MSSFAAQQTYPCLDFCNSAHSAPAFQGREESKKPDDLHVCLRHSAAFPARAHPSQYGTDSTGSVVRPNTHLSKRHMEILYCSKSSYNFYLAVTLLFEMLLVADSSCRQQQEGSSCHISHSLMVFPIEHEPVLL